MRILVVDDNDDAATTMAILLKHCGHTAYIAESGDVALEQAPVLKPDVMFIDLAMPRLSGLEVARRLRQMPECAQTPLIAVSGFVDAEHRKQAREAGFDEFLPKPYPLDDLLETLARIQDKARKSRGLSDGQSAAQSLDGNETSKRSVEGGQLSRPSGGAEPIPFTMEKSGISDLITLSIRAAAEELRSWLKEQRCRVGPIFKPADQAERFGFFVYSRRRELGELMRKNARFQRLTPERIR